MTGLALWWLSGAVAAEGVRLGSEPMVVPGELTGLFFSADGAEVLAFGAYERVAHVWDAHTGRGLGTLNARLESPVQAVGSTLDGAHLLVGWEDGFAVFDAKSLARERVVDMGGKSVLGFSVLPDGRVLVSAQRGGIHVFDPTSWTETGAFDDGGVYRLFVPSDDGRYVAACSELAVTVWSAADATVQVKHAFESGSTCAGLGFALGRSELWMIGTLGQRWTWNATSGAEAVAQLGHGRIRAYSRTPGSPVGFAATEKGLVVMDASDGHMLRNTGPAPVPFRAATSPDGLVAAVSTGSSSFGLVLPTSGSLAVTVPPGHAGSVAGFGWGGAVVYTGATDGKVMSWTAADGRRTSTIDLEGGAIVDLAASSTDMLLVAAASGAMLTPTKGGTVWYADGRWRSVALSRDGIVAAVGAENGNVALVNGSTGQARGVKVGGAVNRIALSPDAKRLAVTTANNHLYVIDVAKAEITYDGSLDRPKDGYVVGVGWSPDGKWVWTAGASGVVSRWTPGGAKLEDAMRVDGVVTDLAVLPSGRLVVGTADGRVSVLDPSGKLIAMLSGHSSPIIRVSASPDGARIGTSDAAGVVLVHAAP